MTGVSWPAGFRLERLAKRHRRRTFASGQTQVDAWLATKALQQQDKRLSSTKVLLNAGNSIVGFYTLATGQVDFSDLPHDIVRRLPHRLLPVAVLAWLGVDQRFRRQGLGSRLLAQALADCHTAGEAFPFVAVVLDCIDAAAKSFYQSYDFAELPGRPFRLFLPATKLDAMMRG